MANRRITEFPAINGIDINEQDLLTLVHVFEVDPTLRNKKITFEQFKDYLNTYYASISGTTFSGNVAISGNLTVSGLGSFGTILSSGLSTFSGIVVQNNAVVSGTVSGTTITGTNLQGVNVNATTVTTTTATGTTALFTSGQYQSLSGATITGGQGSFTSGTFVNLSGTTITGTTVAATTGTFQTLSTPVLNVSGNLSVASGLTVSGTAQFASTVQVTGTLSGTTVTGTAARFTTVTGVTGIFTTTLSGATITGTAVRATSITGATGTFTTRVSGALVTGNTGSFGNVSGISGVFTQFLSGAVITGGTGQFTAITGISGVYTNLSGATVTGDVVVATSITGVTGVFTSRVSGTTITGTTAAFTTVSGVSGVFTTNLSGATITGDSVQASGLTAGTGNFIRVSGTTVTGDTGAFTNLTGIVGVFTTSVSGTTVIGATVTGTTGTFTSLTGTTITGTTVNATTGVFNTLQAVNLSFTNTTVSGNLTVIGSGYFGSGVSVTGTISGITVTGTTANFTSGNFVSISGGTYIAASGVFASGTATNPSLSFINDSNTGIYTSAADQVSITTSGVERLRVDSTGQIEAVSLGTAFAPTYSFTTDPNTGIYSPGADQLAISTGGSGRLFVSSTGRVGLGTASSIAPSAPLDDFHIASTDPAVLLEETDAGTDEKYWRIRAEGSILRFEGINDAFNTATSWLNVTRSAGARTADNIVFNTGTNERLRITSSGLVGVGTISPSTLLHLSGSATTAIARIANIDSGASTFNGSGAGLELLAGGMNTTSKYTPAIKFGSTDPEFTTTNPKFGAAITAVAAQTYSSDTFGGMSLGFWTSPINPGTDSGLLERLTITSAGLVGVGTSAPESALQVNGTVSFGEGSILSSSILPHMYRSGGNLFIQGRTDGGAGGSINLATAGTPRITVLSGGNVGIGTTSPGSALEINAAAATSPFIAKINTAEAARIDSSGKLLVGASTAITTRVAGTSITAPLQVAGAALSTSSSLLANYSTAATSSSYLLFSRSKSGTVGTNTVVVANDRLGAVSFAGYDGANQTEAARIISEVDGTVTTDGMPGRLSLWTSASGSSAPTERLRITSTGRLGLATTAPAALAHIAGDSIISNVDLANASYDSISFSVAAEETSPAGLFFSPDGRKMFVTGASGDDINEYTLSTPWNVSTATYVTVFSVAGQDTAPQDLYFRNDGKKLYIVGNTNDTVYQYSLSNPWSIASASYDSISFSVTTEDATPTGLVFKPDGLAFYITGNTNDSVHRYNLSTAWNVSTATFANSFSVTAQESNPQAVTFTADGSRMFVMGASGDDVNIYNLTTPWDITTAAFVAVFSVAAQDIAPNGLFVKPDGTKFYMVGSTNDAVYQYTIPSATIDLTGTTAINGSAEVAQDLTVRGGVGFYGTDAIAQPAGTGETTGFTAGTGTAVNDASTFTGNLGTTAYRINDVVKALKQLGLLKL